MNLRFWKCDYGEKVFKQLEGLQYRIVDAENALI